MKKKHVYPDAVVWAYIVFAISILIEIVLFLVSLVWEPPIIDVMMTYGMLAVVFSAAPCFLYEMSRINDY